MRSDDAKKLPLDQILWQLGFSPAKSTKNGRELWYTSPFREEKDPSFHISLVPHSRLGSIWVWKDFGDRGGNVVDFALRYYRLAANDVSAALARLEALSGGRTEKAPSPPLMTTPSQPTPDTESFTDVQIGPLNNPRLLTYLAERGIKAELAKLYLQQARYSFDDKIFSALAFRNDQSGYELRSTGRFKGTLPPKGITTLHPEKLASCKAMTVFEGFSDYLSALTYYGKTEADTPVIILNSATMQEWAIETIRQLGATKLHLYLDRDTTGRRLAESFKEQLPDLEILDHSDLYDGHKDFNEFLVTKQKGYGR